MPDWANLLLFMAAGLALNLTPGPDMLYCATRAACQGRAAGVLSALGGGLGGLIHTVAASLGLSALMAYSTTAFLVVKFAGAAYLVYLGVRMVRAGKSVTAPAKMKRASYWRIFSQGTITTVLNPKVAVFFLSFLPQFVDPSRGTPALQFLLLGALFTTSGTIVNTIVGLMFGYVGNWLERRPLFWRVQRYVSGSILVGLGLSLALPDRR